MLAGYELQTSKFLMFSDYLILSASISEVEEGFAMFGDDTNSFLD